MDMDITDFNFELPEHLIAQTPLEKRSSSKLLVLHPDSYDVEHDYFLNIGKYLQEGDTLVVNDSRVLPARLFGIKKETNAKVELLLLHEKGNNEWEVLIKPAKKVHEGTVLSFGEDQLTAICTKVGEEGKRTLKFFYEGIFLEILDKLGEMPLPPYIKEQLLNPERYQTVYAKENGSAAAPTAGLHFTTDLLNEIKQLGVNIVPVTLHVGLGTFRPVMTDQITEHHMHSEYYELTEKSASILNETKEKNQKIIAVGTTSTRVLETIAQKNRGKFMQTSGWTNIFIYPPFEFRAIDGLITNFHLPKSTLLMLISAFVDRETILKTYAEAVRKEYRFFSFGDAMFIKY